MSSKSSEIIISCFTVLNWNLFESKAPIIAKALAHAVETVVSLFLNFAAVSKIVRTKLVIAGVKPGS